MSRLRKIMADAAAAYDDDPDVVATRQWRETHQGYMYDRLFPGSNALYPTYVSTDELVEFSCLSCGYTGLPVVMMYNHLCGRCRLIVAWPVYGRQVFSVVGPNEDGKFEVIQPL